MDAAQSILQRAPPGDLEKNIKGIQSLLRNNPDALDSLTKNNQIPFQVIDPSSSSSSSSTDKNNNNEKPFLQCRWNKVGDKYRSPWTNQLHYPNNKVGGGQQQQKEQQQGGGGGSVVLDNNDFRLFESKLNDVWESYKNLYYGQDAVCSVYLIDKEKGAMSGMFGIQKKCSTGSWNSISLISVDEPENKTCNYRVETTVLLILEPENTTSSSKADISALVTKEANKSCDISKSILAACHIENLGKLIEANEIDLRSSLERVDIPKMKEVMDGMLKKESKIPKQVNPLMGMIMDSAVLKKKMAKA